MLLCWRHVLPRSESDAIARNVDFHGVEVWKTFRQNIAKRLAQRPDGTVGLKTFKQCVNLIHELPSLVYNPSGGEDIDPNTASDHLFDSLRYALTYKKTWFRTPRIRWAHGP
jgi:hypothetical protein